MRLLDRYLLRELLIPLIYCLAGFLLFWIAFDLFTNVEDFQENSVPPAGVARYYLINLPEFLVLVIPIALLLALLYALTNHARHQELTAMRAAGVSLWRIALPYLAVGFFSSLGVFAMNELLVPTSMERASRVLFEYRAEANKGRVRSDRKNYIFRNARGDRIWKMESFDFQTSEMLMPEVLWTLPSGSRREIFAHRAEYNEEEVWVFHDVQVSDFPPEPGGLPRIDEMAVLPVPEFTETPDQIKSEIKVSALTQKRAAKKAQLSISEILHYRRLHPELRGDQLPSDLLQRRRQLEVQLQGRLAEPWTCLVVVLIAVPFAAKSGRRNVFVGVAASIFICFAYFIFLRLGLALGIGGYLPPWLAAWLPNMTGAAAGVLFMLRVR